MKANLSGTTNNLQPFINTGLGANSVLASAYGLNGTDPALGKSTMEQFQQSPDYQFALRGGSEALDNSAASRGGVLSGNQIRAQTEYGSGLATQNLQSYFSRLSGMSQQGQSAAGTLGQIGANMESNIAQIGAGLGNGVVGANASTNIVGSNNQAQSTMAAGTAEASGTLGIAKGINSGLSSLSLYNQLGQSSYRPSNYNGNQIGGLY
jgi:hypothetical protein